MLVTLIGAVDRVTPWDGFFTLLYLAPVALAATSVGRRFAYLLGLVSACFSYLGKLSGAYVLGSFGELGIFLLVAFLANSLVEALHRERTAQGNAADARVENLHLAAAVGQADEGIVITDAQGIIGYVNPAFTRITGYAKDEVTGRKTSCLKSGLHDEAFYRDLWETIRAGRIWRGDINNKRKDGAIYVERMTIAPVRRDGQEITHYIAIKRDVTEERAIEDARARMAAILEATSDFVGTASPSAGVLFVNRAGRKLAGLDETVDVAGLRIADFHSESAQTLLCDEAIPAALKHGEWHGETTLRRRDGREVAVSQVILAHKKPDGTVDFLSTIMRDITELKRVENALRLSERRYRSLFDGMNEGFAYCKLLFENGEPSDFIYLDVNPAFERLTGLADVAGKCVTEVIPGFRETNQEMLDFYGRVARTGRPERLEAYVPGLGIWFDISAYSPAKGDFVAVFDNVTARKKAEETLQTTQEQFRQAQKMEAVGRLAGGVAHDFNNMLGVILGYTELILHKDGLPDPLRAKLAQVLNAAERAKGLTGQLLAFSRKQVLAPKILELNVVVASVMKMMERLIGEDIAMSVQPGVDLGQVYADAGQLEQVILNLAVNARDAMPKGGHLMIETRNVVLEHDAVTPTSVVPAGRYVTLSVCDDGCGMSATTLAHIFEPFFTTKESGKGTGLGLASVYGIVTQSGGQVVVETEPDHGTTFRLYLPRVDAPVDLRPDENARPRVVGGTETILLVEDDADLRDITRDLLELRGYRVLVAANAEQAFALAQNHSDRLHALITDVVMPGLDGNALAQRLLALRPEMKVLFMSGYTDDRLVNRGVLDGPVRLLTKPFTEKALMREVRAALDDTVATANG